MSDMKGASALLYFPSIIRIFPSGSGSKVLFRTDVHDLCADLSIGIPPAPGLFAARSSRFGGGGHVEPEHGGELHSREGVWEDSFGKDLHFGLFDAEKHKT